MPLPSIGEPVRFIHPARPNHPYYAVGCVEKMWSDKVQIVTRRCDDSDKPNPITDRTDESVVINLKDLR